MTFGSHKTNFVGWNAYERTWQYFQLYLLFADVVLHIVSSHCTICDTICSTSLTRCEEYHVKMITLFNR
jgi:hypothetical protein